LLWLEIRSRYGIERNVGWDPTTALGDLAETIGQLSKPIHDSRGKRIYFEAYPDKRSEALTPKLEIVANQRNNQSLIHESFLPILLYKWAPRKPRALALG